MILISVCLIELENIILGVLFSTVLVIVVIILFKLDFQAPKIHYKNISKSTIYQQNVEISFDDGEISPGIIYRSRSDTINTPHGRCYPEARPAIIFFHGFWAQKEVNEMLLIPLAHMGYISIAFDQRGHGSAGGKKSEWYKLYNDAEAILDYVCELEDVKEGALCCIGKSMGGTTVLTKCYRDERVGMVIGISALHAIDVLLDAPASIFSSGWFVRRIISRVDQKDALEVVARNYLKQDANYNKDRVYLIHGKKDKIFPPELTFELNKQHARIPDDHAIILEDCGHSFRDQKFLVFGIILKWILENGSLKMDP
jgi:pimeloyl-ACP methyl ester carboxylesterase